MAREIKHFNRFELKYLVPIERIPVLVDALGEYVRPDPYCPDEGGYEIHSLYFDSPGRTFFWEKIEGEKYRRKLRFRRYGDSPDVWLEIKQRIDRTLQKRRVRWPVKRAEQMFLSGHLDEEALRAEGDPILSEIVFLWRYYGLVASVATSYRRRAFFGSNESNLRVTFDSNVSYHATDLTLVREPERAKVLIDPRLAVMEIKYDESVPLWLCRIVSRFGLDMIRLSKYCTAIDREFYRGGLT